MAEKRRSELAEYIIENQEKFYRLAFSYAKNKEAALDIVQNAIVKALEHQNDIRNKEYYRTWFYRILVNESLTYLRKSGRETLWEPMVLNNVLEKDGGYEKNSTEIYDEVMKRPEEMKTIIILRYYEDLPLAEIADVLQISLSKVKYRLYTALEKLRQNCA